MKYGAYPKYRDSGVEWIGGIPDGWTATRVRYLVDLNPSKNEVTAYPNEVNFLAMESIGEDGSLDLSVFRPWEQVSSAYTYFRNGDVVYAIVTPCFENGKGALISGLAGGVGFGTTELTVLRPRTPVNRKWLWYVTVSQPFRAMGQSWMYGAGGLKRVPDDFARQFVTPVPEHSVQSAIASFLDMETAKIDALVSEYEDLIALLTEKRQVLISHAVTKGLSELVDSHDPAFGEWARPVRFVDSGVDWLGEIPEGWRVPRLSYVATVENGSTPSRNDPTLWSTEDTGIPWLSSGDVNQYVVTSCSEWVSEQGLASSSIRLLPIGTIIVGMIGEGKTRGTSARLAMSATINQNIAGVVPSERLSSEFLHFVFQSSYDVLRNNGRGGNQAALNCEILSAFRIPEPSPKEQSAIAAFLTRETTKIDTLVSEARDAVELLKEHRSALITAAVTGKINVENQD